MTALWSPLRARPPSGLEPFPNPRRSAPEALPSGPGWSNSPGTVSLELPTAEPPSDRPRSRRNPGGTPEPPAPLRTARPGASPRRVPAHPRPTRLRAGSGAPPAPLHHRKLRPLPLPTPYWAAGRHLLLYSHSHWAGETPIERMLPPHPQSRPAVGEDLAFSPPPSLHLVANSLRGPSVTPSSPSHHRAPTPSGARSWVASRARAGSSSLLSLSASPALSCCLARRRRLLAVSRSPRCPLFAARGSGKVGARGGSGRHLHLRARVGGGRGGPRRGWQGGGARQPRPLRAEPPGGARPSASAAQRPPARGGRGLGARRERSGGGLRGRAVPAGSCGVGPFPAWSRVGRVPAAGLPVFPSFTNAEFQHLRPHRRARLAPRALHARPFSLPRLVSPLPTLTR